MDGSEKTTLESEVSKPKQNKRIKKETIIIFSIIVIIFAITTILLFHFLYKVPYDQAIANFNAAVEEYNTAVIALEEKNKELDDNIESLRSTVNADNLPLDETLLAGADAVLEEARSVPRDSAPALPEMPSKTDDINVVCSEITRMTNEVATMGDYSDTFAKLAETQSKYETLIQQFQGATSTVMWIALMRRLLFCASWQR
ncbi:MAG: hypothetical protein ACOYJC_10950 [Christensenellales bacterium]|jgi:hypothetical protein